MKLKTLLKRIKPIEIIGKTDIDIKEIKIDSKKVVSDTLFICLRGKDNDGHKFIKEVERYGAVAIISEKRVERGYW